MNVFIPPWHQLPQPFRPNIQNSWFDTSQIKFVLFFCEAHFSSGICISLSDKNQCWVILFTSSGLAGDSIEMFSNAVGPQTLMQFVRCCRRRMAKMTGGKVERGEESPFGSPARNYEINLYNKYVIPMATQVGGRTKSDRDCQYRAVVHCYRYIRRLQLSKIATGTNCSVTIWTKTDKEQ